MEENKIIVSDDYQKAFDLDRKIKVNARIMQESLYEVCKGLKEMRDGKLYKELGYQNFEDYSEQEIGIKRRQAYNYISIIENIGEENVQSIAQIGMTKLLLLSKLDETSREEIIENTDIENTSVKKLEEQIKNLNSELDKAKKDSNSDRLKITELVGENDSLKKANEEINSENEILSERIEELENKPVEIAVSDNSHELENMRKAMADCDLKWRTDYDKLQEEIFTEQRKHNQEVEEIKAEYEQRIAQLEKPETIAVTDNKEIFKAYLSNAVDSSKRLLEFVHAHKDCDDYQFFMDKVHGLFRQLGGENNDNL